MKRDSEKILSKKEKVAIKKELKKYLLVKFIKMLIFRIETNLTRLT